MSRVFLKREFGINWVEYANIKKTDDNSTITISNGDDHTLIKSDEDIILNGRRMGGFLLYSGSGKLYIDRGKIACRKFDIYVNIDIGFRA